MGQGQTWKKQNKKQDAANFFFWNFSSGVPGTAAVSRPTAEEKGDQQNCLSW